MVSLRVHPIFADYFPFVSSRCKYVCNDTATVMIHAVTHSKPSICIPVRFVRFDFKTDPKAHICKRGRKKTNE